jgi:hypothetical protein
MAWGGCACSSAHGQNRDWARRGAAQGPGFSSRSAFGRLGPVSRTRIGENLGAAGRRLVQRQSTAWCRGRAQPLDGGGARAPVLRMIACTRARRFSAHRAGYVRQGTRVSWNGDSFFHFREEGLGGCLFAEMLYICILVRR